MMRMTKTGMRLLAVLVALYFASITSQSSLLLFPIGIIAACYVANLLLARRSAYGVELKPPRSAQVSEGAHLTEPWQVINRANRPAGLLRIESLTGVLCRVAEVGAKSETRVVPDWLCARRGVYSYSQLRISSEYPFGLIRIARPLDLPGEIVVSPALYPAHSPRAAGYDSMVGGKLTGARRVASGAQFAGVRPHQPGDPLKQIHWKSSAKGLGLMVKTFDEELSGRVAFVVDCGHTDDAATLDDCLRAAGSLMFAALDAGHHIELVDLARTELLVVPPFADGAEILDRLARVELEANCVTEERLTRALARPSSKSALCFVLTGWNEAVESAVADLRNRNRTVSVYLPAGARSSDSARIEKHQRAELELCAPLDVPVFHYTEHEILEPA